MCIITFIAHNDLIRDSLCFLHFTNKETETEELRCLPKNKEWSLNLSEAIVPSLDYRDHARELTGRRDFCEPNVAHGMWSPLNAS